MGLTIGGMHRVYPDFWPNYIGSKSGKKYRIGSSMREVKTFVSTSLNKRNSSSVLSSLDDVVCLSGVFRVCEVAD